MFWEIIGVLGTDGQLALRDKIDALLLGFIFLREQCRFMNCECAGG